MKIKLLSGIRLAGKTAKSGDIAEVSDAVGIDLIYRAKAKAMSEKAEENAEPESKKTDEPQKSDDKKSADKKGSK